MVSYYVSITCLFATKITFFYRIWFACWLPSLHGQINGYLLTWQVLRMVVSTYQAESGAGAAAMEELKLQTQEVHIFFSKFPCPVNVFVWLVTQCFTPYFRSWKGRRQHAIFSNSRLLWLTNWSILSTYQIILVMNSSCWISFSLVQYAFNIFSHNAPVLENGYNEEEMKMVNETRKIWVSLCGPIGLNSFLWSLHYSVKLFFHCDNLSKYAF